MSTNRPPENFYPQGSLNVASYDLRAEIDGRLFDDPLPFYRDLARRHGGPVLELGCGTGRIAAAIHRDGITVEGLDLSSAMLAHARGREPGINWHEGNMCQFDLGRQFALVIIAFRGFQEIVDADLQRRCLTRAFDHLLPGGWLALDLVDPDLRYCVPAGDPDIVELPPYPMPPDMGQPGSHLRVTAMERTSDPLTQRFDEHWRFEEIRADGTVRQREDFWHQMRWVYRSEMRLMLELVGFVSISEFSDFNGKPPRYAANQVWLAQRPAM